jgi:hypothetical protein
LCLVRFDAKNPNLKRQNRTAAACTLSIVCPLLNFHIGKFPFAASFTPTHSKQQQTARKHTENFSLSSLPRLLRSESEHGQLTIWQMAISEAKCKSFTVIGSSTRFLSAFLAINAGKHKSAVVIDHASVRNSRSTALAPRPI